jgi:hypothetical protein
MKDRGTRFAVTTAVLCLVAAAPCLAQSVLNQNSDELLKGFDVDPAYLNQYQRKSANTDSKGLLHRLIEAATSLVSVERSSTDPSIKVKAPFVNVNVSDGQSGVKVKAPFVNIESNSGVSVNAPFVSVNQPVTSTAPLKPETPIHESELSEPLDSNLHGR